MKAIGVKEHKYPHLTPPAAVSAEALIAFGVHSAHTGPTGQLSSHADMIMG